MAMPTPVAEPWNRRAHPRASGNQEVVTIVHGSQRQTFTLRDFSITGASLVGGFGLLVGEIVQLQFPLGGRPVELAARVLRCSGSLPRCMIAVEFRDTPERTREYLRQVVVDERERRSSVAQPTLLVIEDGSRNQDRLSQNVVGTDWQVVTATTPRDLVRILDDTRLRVETALIDHYLGTRRTGEILDHLVAEHEPIRRVVVCSRDSARAYDDDIPTGRVHAVLVEPWDELALIGVLSARH
jgi:CheY-like chemotaxis protein